MSSELIPHATVDEVVGYRDLAVEAYTEAADHLRRAAEAMEGARKHLDAATGGVRPSHYLVPKAQEIEAFDAARVLDPDQFERTARRLADIRVWASLIERTELDHLMDKEAKDELRQQMAYVPEVLDRSTGALINEAEIAQGLPPIDAETIRTTLEGFAQESPAIFKRGLANAFAGLDRRFRSHDGFKVGSRVILTRAFDDWGSWNYYTNLRDTLVDIERVFLVLDGKGPRAAYGGIVGQVDTDRKGGGLGKRQSEHEGEFFRVRIFKNGNAHLWFTRDDLLATVNSLLMDHYSMGWGRMTDENAEPDPLQERAVGQARNFGFFPTPERLAEDLVDEVRQHVESGALVLEPSAGTGRLAFALAAQNLRVDCVEIQPEHAERLRAAGLNVACQDFLTVRPTVRHYDAVLMNPPFDRERDIDHVRHAWDFLKPGGRLVAVMSAGTEFRETRKAQAFRKLMESHGARWRDLPAGTFAAAGTMVNAVVLSVRKSD